MHKANRTGNWGLILALLFALLLPFAPVRAAGGGEDSGLTMTITKRPFTEIVQMLARESGMNLVILDTVDDIVNKVDITNKPAKEIIANLAKPLGLAFWQDGDTFYLGKPRTTVTAPIGNLPALDAAPVDRLPGIVATPSTALVDRSVALPALKAPAANPGDFHDVTDVTVQQQAPKAVIKKIRLDYFSVVELLWALGKPGPGLGGAQAEARVRDRIRTFYSPGKSFNINASDPANYAANSAPWLSSAVSGSRSRTDANQIRNPRGPAATDPTAPNYTAPNQATPTTASTSSLSTAELTPFIPEGIKDIVGLVGLNALLVRADTEDDIDQLEMLIKLLDQPVKQVIVECMIVKMSVQDAMAMGVSWTYAGMPLSVISSNGGNEGNFAVSYVKGSVKVALATALSNSTNKVVQAPRVIVPNGGTGSISLDDEVPFITVTSETDVFGRTITNPSISYELFQQGLYVDYVMIHPDETITIDVSPIIDIPTVSVPIPGGAGDVIGHQTFDLQSLVTVKNGETVLLGGFTSKTEAQSGSRAPLLGNLPVIGPLLFRNKSRSVSNAETLVFVTATIMKDDTPIFGEMAPLPPLF
jgi:hypothetical protein